MTTDIVPIGTRRHVDAADWAALADELEAHGCALTSS
jgi:hypothetical protein